MSQLAGLAASIPLERGEEIEVVAEALDATIIVTDRRLVVATPGSLVLDIPFERLRRIEFDVEKGRPAALVVVPEWPGDRSQILSIGSDQYPQVARVLSAVGARLQPTE
jgi:hypothetical protein